MLKVTVFVIFAFIFSTTSAFSWIDTWGVGARQSQPQARDCTWTTYYTVIDCHVTGINKYEYRQERLQIPAQNGGNPCTGLNYRYLPCSELEYVAITFKKNVGYAAANVGGGGGGGAGFRSASTASNNKKCSKDFVDKNKNLRMAGLRCGSGNKTKRSLKNLRQEELLRSKRQAILSTKHRDITILIDESGSVGPDKFKKFIKLGKALVNSFCGAIRISKQQTRVGVMTFDAKQHYHINFDTFFDKVQLLTNMDKIPYNSKTHYSTCLVDALKQTRDEMITQKRGARVNHPQTTERVVIMMTDGCANCNQQGSIISDLQAWRKKFEDQKIPFITFFVGDNQNCVEIMREGLANGALCYQVFRAMNWGELDQMISAIETSPCMDAWTIGPSCPT